MDIPFINSIINLIHCKVILLRTFALFSPKSLEKSQSRDAYLISHFSRPLRKFLEGSLQDLGRLGESHCNSRKVGFSFPLLGWEVAIPL